MIPLKDNLPTSRFPVVTVVLIAINVAFFIWQLAFPTDPQLENAGYTATDQSYLEYGAIPYRITQPTNQECSVGAVNDQGEAGVVCPGTTEFTEAEARGEVNPGLALIPLEQAAWFITLFTSMFMHAGLLHLGFNMLFLWVFGNNIEDALGRLKFVLFYLAAGLAAVYAHAALDAGSTVPVIGASGAVAGVLGAYVILHPRARVLSLIFLIFFVTLIEVQAWIWIGVWFALQFVGQLTDTAVEGGGGTAYFAHVGGFLFGLATIKLLAGRHRDPEPRLPVY